MWWCPMQKYVYLANPFEKPQFTLTRCNSIDFFVFREAARVFVAIFWRLFNVVKGNQEKKETLFVCCHLSIYFRCAITLTWVQKMRHHFPCFEQKARRGAESFVLCTKTYYFYLRTPDKCTKKTSVRCPPCLFEKCNRKKQTENCRRPREKRYLWRSAWPDPRRQPSPLLQRAEVSLCFSAESVCISPECV